MYGFESWTTKKAECQKIDAFELWYWRRLLRVPWTVRISNQSILREINSKYSWEGLMLKLKTSILCTPDVNVDSLGKTLMKKDWGQEETGRTEDEMLDGISDLMDINLRRLQEIMKGREVWHAAVYRVAKSRTWLSEWTTTLERHRRQIIQMMT